ncbi:CAP domain-containing protein [Dactylosporangium sp. NPDC051485]|uniref:CAP domain-containing protein n=1 Tax=Dactylosporangium sp. NPDC051485 TaxID=3154846 RepID=UPI00343BE5F1
MTRFARRATTIAAAGLAAALGLAIVTTTGPQALAAGAPVAAGVAHVVEAVGANAASAATGEDAAAKLSKKKKKKKSTAKKTPVKPEVRPTKPATTPAAPAPPVTTPTGDGTYAAIENDVVTLTNNFRQANGCGALRVDGRLVAAARAHSTDMVTHNFFDHTGSNGSNFVQREAAAGYTTGASAENIAWGYRTAQDVVNGWINSPGHRANLLNCSSVAVGVGLVYKTDGTPYWTQDFGRV